VVFFVDDNMATEISGKNKVGGYKFEAVELIYSIIIPPLFYLWQSDT